LVTSIVGEDVDVALFCAHAAPTTAAMAAEAAAATNFI
jgi:hypothetical protein